MQWNIKKEHIRPFLFFLLFYFGVRTVSLLDVTLALPLLSTMVAGLLCLVFSYVAIQRTELAFVLLIAEIILGSSGQFVAIGSVSLRTCLLVLFFIIWGTKLILKKESFPVWPRTWRFYFLLTLIVIAIASLVGISSGHSITTVRQDVMLYGFLLLALPASMYMSQLRIYILPIISAYLVGTATFIALTLARYSSGIGIIHDTYYKWFRDVVGGKITDIGLGMFRITTADQILLVPIILYLFGYGIREVKKGKWYWLLVVLSLALLTINLTRIYFLAIFIGAIVLFTKQYAKKWIGTGLDFGAITICSLMLITGLATQGSSFGAHIIGLKAAPITSGTDVSANTRALIWPEARELIIASPLIGQGLGTTITFIDPATNQSITRTQFDMGYIEQLVELGIIGLAVYLGFVLLLARELAQTNKSAARCALAGLIALGIVNITKPALFEGFGVVYIGLCAGYVRYIKKSTQNT